jgi:hypothetical protein
VSRIQSITPAVVLALAGCHSQSSEPPPPPATYELAVAPPGARGARAAGTDAAPPPPSEGELPDPGSDVTPEPEDEPDDDGGVTDGGAQADAAPGVAL